MVAREFAEEWSSAMQLPANMISFADTQRVVEFLHTYAEANAILLPGIQLHSCAAVAIQYDKASGVATVLWVSAESV